ncbi:MAG TPA: hypothetical protein VLB46_21750 [Pyrinomonadaceae bacterium]|nr:hypothetical protein [Pyrinomonadaceae bacterium]
MTSDDSKPTLYEILEAWIRGWEELLKEPVNLLLNRSFCNLIKPALVELKPYFAKSRTIERSANNWARGLLELLETRFRESDFDIYFYRLEYPHEVAELEHLLKQGKFDVLQIYPLLRKINNGPSENTILIALRDELLTATDMNFDLFITGSALLLRRALPAHSPSSLKEKLSVSLARHGGSLAARTLVKRINEDRELFNRMAGSWNSFLNELRFFDIDAVKSDPAAGLTKLFDLFSWDYKARILLDNVRTGITSFLISEKSALAVDAVAVRSRAESELNQILRREYSLAYLRQLFEMPIGGARFESEHLQNIGQEVATILLESSFEDKQFRHSEPYRPNPVDACCADSFVETIKEIARAKFSSALDEIQLPEIEPSSLHELTQKLWTSEPFLAIKWNEASDITIEDACDQWLSSVGVQKQLVTALTPSNVLLLNTYKLLLDNKAFSTLEEWIDSEIFWERWGENLSRVAPWNRGIFHYIPWDGFDEAEVRYLFSRVTTDFLPVDDAGWSVVFTVRNLDPPPTPKHITGITFYDPIQWDYGEKVLFSKDVAKHTTSARLKVTARSFLESKRIAAAQLRDVLNCMALSLSVSRMRGGFKPTIDPEVFARRLSSPSWSSDRPLIRNEHPITQSFLNFERFGPMFDFLIRASRSASSTMLQQKLLRALHWYSKARWDDDAAQSLLFYWIGLEHLFEEGNDDRLLNLIAELHINWRDVLSYGWYFLGRHQSDVRKQLKADPQLMHLLSLDDGLRDWNKDVRILFSYDNVQKLLKLIPSEKKALRDYVQGYADYLYGFVKDKDVILQDMEALRAKYRFRLLVIKQIRNDIVHQALGYESNVGLYTDELEKIFEEMIVKLTNDAIREVPQCTSIKDLIAQYAELWIS